jgi:monofunctional biosynthetic peptidoglycan transglycosylase
MNYVDFDAARSVNDWKTVDDPVMGGHSHSHIHWVDAPVDYGDAARGFLRFEGIVSLENNGGFCSARLVDDDRGATDFGDTDAFRLLVRGDGHRYKFTVRTDDTPPKSSWRHPFEPPPGPWTELLVPITDFELWRRGTHLSAEDRLDPTRIRSVGVLISDKQEGPFRIDLARVRLHRSASI